MYVRIGVIVILGMCVHLGLDEFELSNRHNVLIVAP